MFAESDLFKKYINRKREEEKEEVARLQEEIEEKKRKNLRFSSKNG